MFFKVFEDVITLLDSNVFNFKLLSNSSNSLLMTLVTSWLVIFVVQIVLPSEESMCDLIKHPEKVI